MTTFHTTLHQSSNASRKAKKWRDAARASTTQERRDECLRFAEYWEQRA